jgi:hypothetical protein
MLEKITAVVGGVVNLALSIVILVGVWVYDAGFLNQMMDVNLSIIKWLGSALPAPYGDKTESALRFIAGEKAMILIEISIALKILGNIFTGMFRSKSDTHLNKVPDQH